MGEGIPLAQTVEPAEILFAVAGVSRIADGVHLAALPAVKLFHDQGDRPVHGALGEELGAAVIHGKGPVAGYLGARRGSGFLRLQAQGRPGLRAQRLQ